MAGLTLAHRLKDVAQITLFEKARGVGGRMATRYADPYRFDHGAQFFYAKTPAFRSFIAPMIDQGVVQRWDGHFMEFESHNVAAHRDWDQSYPHYVGAPGMNAVGHYLAQHLDVHLNTPVGALEYDRQWRLYGTKDNTLGEFDWVVCTAPAQQTAQLLPASFAHIQAIRDIKMQGCFSLMLGFETHKDFGFAAALVRHADISWISVNSTKPGRDAATTLLVHSTNAWAQEHADDERTHVLDYLVAQTCKIIGTDVSNAHHKALHGWRYANISKQPDNIAFVDADHHLAACGDWCIQGRVEAAFTSAMKLGDAMIPHVTSGTS